MSGEAGTNLMDDIVCISSSDSDSIFKNSDSDLDDDGGVNFSSIRGSSNTGLLPSWASTGGTSSRNSGYDGQSQKASNHERANSSNWTSSRHSVGSGIADQHQTVNSRISNFSGGGTDYEKLSSQQALKRTLPPSLWSYTPTAKSNYVVDSVGSSHTRDWHSNTYYQAGPSTKRDFHGRTSEEAIVLYENNVTRILPPSLTHGKLIQSIHTTSGNSGYRYIPAEESGAGTDERLVYQAALQDLNQPKGEADLPNGLLSVSLLRHQKIALAWMLHKENRTLHCLGGILADDQGLGKTISMIALIQMQKANQSKPKSGDESNFKSEALNLDDDDDKVEQTAKADVKSTSEVNTSASAKNRRRANNGGTLVVCPASVLRQWARELDEKVPNEAKLDVLVYHGGTRTKDPVELAKYDVVLTTYTIVTNEVPKQPLVDEDESDEKNGEQFGLSSEFSVTKKRKGISNGSKKKKKGQKGSGSFGYEFGALARVNWLRVVLDEAQTIKNHRTQVARACCSLRAKKRWCLSGTPIQNSIDDLYSYFRFLRYDPYAVYKSFYDTIKVQIARNSLQGYKKLQAVLRAIMLRRSKGTLLDGEPIINLPPKSICLKKVDFSIEERAFYASLEADSRSKFKAYAAAGTVSQNYASILLMLLRLRQACDHPLLVKGFKSDSIRKGSVDVVKSLDKDRDPPEDPVVTKCGHIFCYQCVSEYLTGGDDNFCPASKCKEIIGSDVVFSEATLRSCVSESLGAGPSHSEFTERLMDIQTREFSSSKIKAVIEILESNLIANATSELKSPPGCSSSTFDINSSAEAPIKTIVFSQWTSMLDLVEMSLNDKLIQYRRLDGKMSLAARDRAVREFNSDSEVTVMLMSLKAGNLGLNMVAACHVIILDLWWNPTTEDQAIDRAHRIGQTRPVTVTRLTIKDTVEDRILALQEEKRKMVASAFGEDQTGGTATRLTVEDLKYLFNFS